jgi:L-seryl-tRNA(Ser) seleniumtransferase
VLTSRALAPLIRRWGRGLITDLVREVLGELRGKIREGELDAAELRAATSHAHIAARVRRAADALFEPRPRPVVTATGVVVHTNLGRSILSADAAGRVAAAARGYVDLEYDLEAGGRGSRLSHLEPLLRRLFPGQEFLVVNNNAAAILLCLRALARRREVLISRGELVEIGGSFRIPDILAASGARLRELGTTNRTRLSDYEKALGPRSGLILKVHSSNFAIVGFTESVPIRSLAELAGRAGLPLVVDWGSGDLVDLGPLGIRDEMPVSRVLQEGADLVTFSGDKLLGGPQAGFVVGRPDLVRRLRRDPLARVCRLDRLLVAALHETLAAHVRGRAFEEVPTLSMLAASPEEIGRRAERLRRAVAGRTGQGRLLRVVDGVSRTGGGSSPAGERPTRLLAVCWPSGDAAPIARRLRDGTPPVIGRVQEGRLLLDLRTVLLDQDSVVAERLAAAIDAELADSSPAADRPRSGPRRRRSAKR